MKLNNLVVLLLVLLPASVLDAQSLDELISIAVRDNLQIKALDNEYLAALEKAPQVSQLPDPEIGIGGFLLPVETRLGAQGVRVSGTQMVPWPGKLETRKELEMVRSKSLLEQIEARRLEVAFEVRQNYLQLYKIRTSKGIILRNIEILRSLERLALSKVESGKGLASDVIAVQIKIVELEQELKILTSAETGPKVNLNQLLHREVSTPVFLVDTLEFAQLPFNKDSLLNAISKGHPVLRMLEYQQDASRKSIEVNELNGRPDLGFGVDYITVSKRSDANPVNNGRDILQLRASVKIPLFRKQYDARKREELYRIEAMEYQKEDAMSRFSATIEDAYADYENAWLQKELIERQIDLTQTAIRILKDDFSASGRSFDELLRLELAVVDYHMQMLEVIVRSHLVCSTIGRYYPNSNGKNNEEQ